MQERPEMEKPSPRDLLGVVLAGGQSRRFGGDKALFPLEGRAMAAWALLALEPWTSEQVVITNQERVAEDLGVQGRPDRIQGLGPVGGLYSALTWAEEKGRDGVFLLACDLPLVSSELVGRIIRRWGAGPPAVVPESPGPLGFEPLCGGYGVGGLPSLEKLLSTSKRSMEDALLAMGGHRIPITEMGTVEELALAFTNVNTIDTAGMVQRLLRERHSPTPGSQEELGGTP